MELGGAEQSENEHEILEGTRTSRSPKTFRRVRPWLDKPCPASRKAQFVRSSTMLTRGLVS